MSKHENYLMIDHRASPGMPEDVLRKAGIDMPIVGEGQFGEFKVLHCVHCQHEPIVNPNRKRERASCHKCGGAYICDACEWQSRQPGYIHTPFVKLADDLRENAARETTGNLYLPFLTKGT